jgi:hypothetical protein
MSWVELIARGVHLARSLLYSPMMIPAEVMSEFPPEKWRTMQTWRATKKAVSFFFLKL